MALGCSLVLGACSGEAEPPAGVPELSGADAHHGAQLIGQYGCASCHTIPGIAGADGLVGPPLTKLARRVYIAGVLRNSPENLMAWLKNPQRIVPGNAMPDMGLNESQARDIAAYLYTLR